MARNSKKRGAMPRLVHSQEMPTFIAERKSKVELIPRNLSQEEYITHLYNPNKRIVFAIGPAGTGKTYLAVQKAIKDFKEGRVNKIVVTRPAVSVDEEIGFLPGTLEQKMAPWVIPVMSIFKEYFTPQDVKNMIEQEIIEIAPLAYMRGRNFKDSFIIADECQLTTPNQMKMLLTRISNGTRMVVTGDLDQSDRCANNGLRDFLSKINGNLSEKISITRFALADIERDPVVKDVLDIYEG